MLLSGPDVVAVDRWQFLTETRPQVTVGNFLTATRSPRASTRAWTLVGTYRESRNYAQPVLGDQDTSARFFRRRSGSPSGRRVSTAAWVLLQMGTARASSLCPLGVRVRTRPRRSVGATVILSRRRRCNGLRAAVNVVRSIPSSDATGPMSGGFGRFRDINRENWPLVSPTGRSASSKRRASARAARCT